MICSFRSHTAEDIFNGMNSKQARKVPTELHSKIQRLLDQLNAVTEVETLKIPPSNRLEKLKSDLKIYCSLRINIQWRVIFEWKNGEAFNVDVIDYH